MFGWKFSGGGEKKNTTTSANTKRGGSSQYGIFSGHPVNTLEQDDFSTDDDDESLEAELMALTAEENKKKPPKVEKKIALPMNVNKLVEECLKTDDSDDDSSGLDDPALLAELNQLNENDCNDENETSSLMDDAVEETCESEKNDENLTAKNDNETRLALQERLEMYLAALKKSTLANDVSRIKRYERGVSSLQKLLKDVEYNKTVNMDDVPPALPLSAYRTDQSDTSELDKTPSSAKCCGSETIGEMVAPKIKTVAAVKTDSSQTNEPKIPEDVKIGSIGPASTLSTPATQFSKNETREMTVQICEPVKSATRTSDQVVTEMEPTPPSSNLETLIRRQHEYKKAALEAKRWSDKEAALEYVKIVRNLATMITDIRNGSSINMNDVPPAPKDYGYVCDPPVIRSWELDEQKRPIYMKNLPAHPSIKLEVEPAISDNQMKTNDSDGAAEAISQPKTILEALNQRLKKYQDIYDSVKGDNSSKTRRFNRIVKQYEEAIKLHNSGKDVPYDELPCPPGYPPIPNVATTAPDDSTSFTPSETNVPKSTVITRNEKQTRILIEKQKLFKQAALKAKRDGNMEDAKEYLKLAKGFDPMIEASSGGLPVDMTTLPITPEDEAKMNSLGKVEVLKLNDCIPGSKDQVYEKLLSDLVNQVELCERTRDHFKSIGDVANANRLQQLNATSRQDFVRIKLARDQNEPVPKFHYETKPFTMVRCNADLSDNVLEVTIVQGINYNVSKPKDVDTYVKVTFPYPTESPQQQRTGVVYNTNNPTYQSVFTFNFIRNARPCQRIFKRQALKCEVFLKGGFFRGDSLIATANVKLQALETQCTLHDAFELMDGRRPYGGKLEVKLRIRNPIVKKQVEHVEEKWLLIDG